MKRKAFTLMEVLVAIGILGVVAAITTPVLEGLIPDKNKIQVLKMNKIITDINRELLENKSLYWTPLDSDCIGFSCTQAPLDNDFRQFTGDDKYINLFVRHLNTQEDYDNSILSNSAASFYTTDGVQWNINYDATTGFGSIIVDLDGTEGRNCLFSNNCTKPDRYILGINFRGQVFGVDPLTQAYLQNSGKLNDKKNDRQKASELSTDERFPNISLD